MEQTESIPIEKLFQIIGELHVRNTILIEKNIELLGFKKGQKEDEETD